MPDDNVVLAVTPNVRIIRADRYNLEVQAKQWVVTKPKNGKSQRVLRWQSQGYHSYLGHAIKQSVRVALLDDPDFRPDGTADALLRRLDEIDRSISAALADREATDARR